MKREGGLGGSSHGRCGLSCAGRIRSRGMIRNSKSHKFSVTRKASFLSGQELPRGPLDPRHRRHRLQPVLAERAVAGAMKKKRAGPGMLGARPGIEGGRAPRESQARALAGLDSPPQTERGEGGRERGEGGGWGGKAVKEETRARGVPAMAGQHHEFRRGGGKTGVIW
ncbi:hypothetical protein MPTK1_7g01550 [Marchantia polymorpha subsp. ruderalis]|uniref:Uncharacterized protein n=2 Tax=Marchantia polymorpha TaxID=3197 RepID=A0AAF6BV30_MARPO|nr:hypothetical protein MARPO_0099s0030 [Marchantia polymorpha]BBN15864.1 hypothetical protein Mp_7g01550 [Marchantia polymorpha subsp. ruderalis]|eukprot:PTQ32393.1 hypothetical protein MARPO_0099s0030 [Marchantia polymorpha]